MGREFHINFYRLLPESDLVTIMRRKLYEKEEIQEWETLLKVPKEDSYQRFAILSKWPFFGDTQAYATHNMRFSAIPRLARARLLDNALSKHFRKHGFDIIRKRLYFNVYDDESFVPCNIKGIELRRGLQFHLDSAFLGQQRHYGYFITLKIGRSFSVGLDKPALQKAATEQRVYYYTDGAETSVLLQKINNNTATVITDEGATLTVSLDSLCVPASAEIVRRYLDEIGAGPKAFGQLLDKEQQAAMRRTPRGQKRRDAAKAQVDFVSTWLIKNSEYGRIRFDWPFSSSKISLLTTQYGVKGAELF